MSAICQIAPGFARRSTAPLAFTPVCGLVKSVTALGALATARLRVQRFLIALGGTHRKGPVGGGGPGEPPEADPAPYCHWDDAALWIMMMH